MGKIVSGNVQKMIKGWKRRRRKKRGQKDETIIRTKQKKKNIPVTTWKMRDEREEKKEGEGEKEGDETNKAEREKI